MNSEITTFEPKEINQPSRQKTEIDLNQLIRTYLKNFLSPRTRTEYAKDFEAFAQFLASKRTHLPSLEFISKEMVLAYREELRTRYSPNSVNRKLSALSSLFRELVHAQVIAVNPVNGVKRPPGIAKRERLGFTDREVNQILSYHSGNSIQSLNHRAVLTFLFYTGCRISEVLNVRVKDLEIRESMPIVVIRGKGDKLRTLPLHPKLSKILRDLIERREKTREDFLFTSVKKNLSEPMRRQSVHELLKKTLKKLKLDEGRSLHSSRRTVISNLLESQARIESVAVLAGHANINTTLKYNVRKEALEENPLLTLRYKV